MLSAAPTSRSRREGPWSVGASTKNPSEVVWSEEGLRGRFAMYVPPVMEELKLAEVEHLPRTTE